jgi:hypothetical protein
LVGLAGGTGLRWDCVDLGAKTVNVIRVAIEVVGSVATKAFHKPKAGRRVVPLPDLEAGLLKAIGTPTRAGRKARSSPTAQAVRSAVPCSGRGSG